MSNDVVFIPDAGSARSPSDPCTCEPPRRRWHWHDSRDDAQPVTCLTCGCHWWMRNGGPVEGPAFEPYTDYLRKLGAAGIDLDEVAVIEPDGSTSLVYDPVGPLPP